MNKELETCGLRLNDASSKKKFSSRLVILFLIGATLFLLLFPQQVSSLGVAPSLFNIDNPGNVINLRLRILNSQHEDLFVTIRPEGSLAKYVELEKTTYRLSPQETEKTINYKIKIPRDLSPGQNVLNMHILQFDEYLKEEDVNGAQLNAKVSVVQRVNINIPYPGQYLAGNLFVQATQTKAPIKFIVHTINKGNQDVNFNGKILIKSPMNQIISTIEIPSSKVLASDDIKLNLEILGLNNPGEYVAEAYLYYGNQQVVFKKQFSVGSMQVDAYDMKISRFKLGEIVKVLIGLSNNWNQEIDDLFIEGKVIDHSGLVVSSFTSNKVSIPPKGLKEIESFWDTADLPVGTYDFDLQLHYGDRITENYFEGGLSVDKASFKPRGSTGNVVVSVDSDETKNSGGLSQTINLLVILIIILIIIVVVLFVTINKKLKKS